MDLDRKFHCLPADWQAAMMALKQIHGTQEPMSIQLVLGVANTVTQCYWNVDSEIYDVRPTSLFLVNMTPTAGRKSTNFREVNTSIIDHQKNKRKQLEHDNLRFVLAEKKFKNDLKQYEKDMDHAPALTTMPIPPRPMETYRYIIKKTTLNGLIDQMKSQSWMSIMSSEGGDFFNGHAFQGAKSDASKSTELTAALTDIWDAQAMERSTGLDRTTLYNRRINMMLLLQESTIREVLNNSNFSEQGFLHRILITQCSDPVFREQTEATIEENNAYRQLIEPFNLRISQMISRPVTEDPERPFEMQFKTMPQTAKSRQVFMQYYNRIVPLAATQYRDWAGFVNRCHEQALRIAATVADYLGETEISGNSAQAGVDLMDFYLDQRLSLDIGVTDPRRDLKSAANKLFSWLEKHPGWHTRREISGSLRWFRDLTADYKDNIITELERTGDIQRRERTGTRKSTLEFTADHVSVDAEITQDLSALSQEMCEKVV
jgi:hypothetical protein